MTIRIRSGLVMVLALTSLLAAQDPAASTRIGRRSTPEEPCVTVDIAGSRAGEIDCAQARLQAAMRAAQRGADITRGIEADVPPNRTNRRGLATPAGAAMQHGGPPTGGSLAPIRPPRPVYPNPLAPAPR